MIETQVCILGGGIGALWVQLELARRGYESTIIEHQRIGAYASTRNQSWLHTGAYYLLLGGTSDPGGAADLCFRSSREIMNFCESRCPEAIVRQHRCVLAFDTQTESEIVLDRIRAFGIDAEPISHGDLDEWEPAISTYIFKAGILCNEHPFDSFPIIRAVLIEGAQNGGKIYISERPLKSVSAKYLQDGRWQISIDDTSFMSSAIIIAAGVYNPLLLSKISERELPAVIERSVIGVTHKPATRNILVLRKKDEPLGGVMFGPFDGGTTVNIPQMDMGLSAAQALNMGLEQGILDDSFTCTNFARRLDRYMPRIGTREMHFYICEKLNNCDDDRNLFPNRRHGTRHFFWTFENGNLYSFYPGKFIAAPIAARSIADHVTERIGPPWNRSDVEILTPVVKVSHTPYKRQATHKLYRDHRDRYRIERLV